MGPALEPGGNYMAGRFSQFVNVCIYTSNVSVHGLHFTIKKKKESLEKSKEEYIRQKFHLSGNPLLQAQGASLAWIKEESCHDEHKSLNQRSAEFQQSSVSLSSKYLLEKDERRLG